VVIRGYLPAGGIFDPDEKLGLADFTATALMRGTKDWDFQEIYEQLESAGASLSIGCATHTISFHGKALAEDLNILLSLLAGALRQPTFPDTQVERLRSQLMTALSIRSQDTSAMATIAFDRIIYANHPYRRPEDGYPETVEIISREDLVRFHNSFYGPRGFVISVVGGISPDEALTQVTQAFGDWLAPSQAVQPALPSLKPLSKVTRQDIAIPGKSQTAIILGTAGPPRIAPDFFAAALGNNILGQFGMMGRIGEAVRERAGLAYYAASSLSGGVGPGPWFISAGVAPQSVDQAIDLIIQEIARFTNEPVSDTELSDSQANFIGRLPLSLETNAGVANALTNLERYQLGLDHYHEFAAQVRAVTPGEIRAAARRYLDPGRLGIAVAGPGREKK
jgi:zinc protease